MVYGKRCYRRPMRSSLVSATIHVVIVSLVVLLTPGIGSTRQRPPERPTIVIYRPPLTTDNPGPVHPGDGAIDTPINTIVAPTTVPPNIPPIDLAQPGPTQIALDTTWGPSPTHSAASGSGGA